MLNPKFKHNIEVLVRLKLCERNTLKAKSFDFYL